MPSVAPVCYVEPTVAPVDAHTPNLPAIPTAQPNDMGSIIAALNALKMAFELLAGQRKQPAPFTGGGLLKSAKAQKKGRWVEIQRIVKPVRVFNPNDHSQYVDVQRTEKLVLQDSVTGEIWLYNL